MTDINEIKRELADLAAKVAAYEAEKAAPPRNWPERIEAGMCFGREDVRYVLFGKRLVNIESGVVWSTSGCPFGGDQSEFVYLGKIDLTIRTDAHEPTGAELVGRRVNCFDTLDRLQLDGDCDEYDPSATYPYRIGRAWYFKARLAK